MLRLSDAHPLKDAREVDNRSFIDEAVAVGSERFQPVKNVKNRGAAVFHLRSYFFLPTRFMNCAPICSPLTQDNAHRR
jgi:hypothetical protein